MQGSLSVLPDDDGDIKIGFMDDDTGNFIMVERLNQAAGRMHVRKVMDALRIANDARPEPRFATAGSIL